MSISSIFGSPILLPTKPLKHATINTTTTTKPSMVGVNGLVIECSSRPQKKATAHHMKTRPKKRQAWDIKRKPTVYPPLPPLPPDWTFVSSGSDQVDIQATSVVDSPASTA